MNLSAGAAALDSWRNRNKREKEDNIQKKKREGFFLELSVILPHALLGGEHRTAPSQQRGAAPDEIYANEPLPLDERKKKRKKKNDRNFGDSFHHAILISRGRVLARARFSNSITWSTLSKKVLGVSYSIVGTLGLLGGRDRDPPDLRSVRENRGDKGSKRRLSHE